MFKTHRLASPLGSSPRIPTAAWIGAGALALLGASACGSGNDTNNGGGTPTTGSLEITFPKLYSAYDGVHKFKVPVAVQGVSGVRWSASNPALVDIETQNNGKEAIITTKGAGQVTIIAEAGGLRGEAPLTITSATPETWTIGQQRYNNGVVFRAGQRTATRTVACTNCHSPTNADDVEHTPAQTGGYTDQELVSIFTAGMKPAGVGQRVMPIDQWTRLHRWEMEEQEKTGIVVYLRSLEPQVQEGVPDFRLPFGGGGQRPDGGFGGPQPPRDGGGQVRRDAGVDAEMAPTP
jgi:hypothetical protein